MLGLVSVLEPTSMSKGIRYIFARPGENVVSGPGSHRAVSSPGVVAFSILSSDLTWMRLS